MMNNLSKRLRDIALTSEPHLTTVVMDLNEAADLIDQQAAEIADLKLRIDRWNSGDNSIGAKEQVKRLMAERNEWRRRAAVLRLHVPEQIWPLFVREFPEAAQWFEEN